MAWWHWIVLGLALVGAELLTPGGFYVIFFGVAALIVGVLRALGFVDLAWVQWSLFSVLSVVSLLLFRDSLLARMHPDAATAPIDSLIGELARPLTSLSPGATGKAELRGTVWDARNGGTETLAAGERCRVTRVDGLTIWIQRETANGAAPQAAQ